jgi:hypothetical protein
MSRPFQTDLREMRAFARWAKSDPRGLGVATGMMLNNQAFGSKKAIGETLETGQIIRNERFINSKIRVKKARFAGPIEQQVSMVGSIEAKRFSGLLEQQTGAKTKHRAVATKAGRSGSRSKVISRRYRLNKPYINPERYPRRRGFRTANPDINILVMLKQLRSIRYRAPFIITGHSKLPPGLYRFKAGKLQLLQGFDPDNLQPQRFKWLTLGVRRYFRRTNLDREWIRIARRVVAKRWGRR